MIIRDSSSADRESAELLAFLGFYLENIKASGLGGRASFLKAFDEISKAHGKSKALQGLRQAANDVLQDLGDIEPDLLSTIDLAARSAGVVTLSEIRRRYSRTYKSILRRGSLRNETEYFLVKGVVDDSLHGGGEAELDRLQSMLSAFESAPNNSLKRTDQSLRD